MIKLFPEPLLMGMILASLGLISISVIVLLRLLYLDIKNKKVW